MSRQVSLYEQHNAQYIQSILESWDGNIQAVKMADENFSDEQAFKLAILLENTNQALVKAERKFINEATQSVDIGPFKKHGFDLITAVMPSLIAEEIVSVQPLTQKIGQIFYLKYLYGSNKGSVRKGDVMFDSFQTSPGYANADYSSEHIDNEILHAGGQTVVEGNLDYTPVRPGTITIKGGLAEVMDDGKGNLKGGATGTIDYNTGAYKLTFSSEPSSAVEAEYHFDLEVAPSTIPQVDIKIEEAIVTARPRKLRALYAFDAAYDLEMSQGVDINDALLTATSHEIRHEIDAEIMLDLYRQAGITSTWNFTYNPQTMNISQKEHRETFIDEIISSSNAMFQATRRAVGNFIIAGKLASDVLESIGSPRYVPSGIKDAVGPHFAGTLDGKFKVYKNPFYNEDEYLIGYKGATFLDAGYTYAPYLPIFASQLIMLDDFVGRRGFATSYGKRMNNNKLYIKGKITKN